MKKKRVYILGQTRGYNRTQHLIKLLVDNWNDYNVYYESIFYSNVVLRYLKSIFINPFVILRSNLVYVCTLNVDLNIFWELLIAFLFRKKIIVDYYVSVYDTVVLDRKWFREGSFLAKTALFLDKVFLTLGSELIFLTNTEKERCHSLAKKKIKEDKCKIISLCNEEKGEIHSSFVYGDKKELCICWWGGYNPLHGIDIILEAMRLLQEKKLPVRCYFFGNNEEAGREYVQMTKDLEVEGICFFENDYTFNNGKLMPFLEENCDLCLGHFGHSGKAMNVMVNKVVEAASFKVNILTGISPANTEFFDTDENIFMCERTAEGIANKVSEIYCDKKENLMNRIESTYQIYQEHFTVQKFKEKFTRFFLS